MDDELRRLERELNTTPADFDLRRKVAQAHRTRGNYLRGNEIMLAPEHIELPPFREWEDKPWCDPQLRFYSEIPPDLMYWGELDKSEAQYYIGLEWSLDTLMRDFSVNDFTDLFDPFLTINAMRSFLSFYIGDALPVSDVWTGGIRQATIGYRWAVPGKQNLWNIRETCMRAGDYLKNEVKYPQKNGDD